MGRLEHRALRDEPLDRERDEGADQLHRDGGQLQPDQSAWQGDGAHWVSIFRKTTNSFAAPVEGNGHDSVGTDYPVRVSASTAAARV